MAKKKPAQPATKRTPPHDSLLKRYQHHTAQADKHSAHASKHRAHADLIEAELRTKGKRIDHGYGEVPSGGKPTRRQPRIVDAK